MTEENDKIESEYIEKKTNVRNYSLVSFLIASLYQYKTIDSNKSINKMPLKVGACILTGGLSYGITYLALRNIYEL